MQQVGIAILLLGFRVATSVFLIVFPIARSCIKLLAKPWILQPIWQGIQYVLHPLAYLEKHNEVHTLSHSKQTLLLTDEQHAVAVIKKQDINQASLAMLSKGEGVGIKRAQEIIDYRNQCGGFRRMEEISLIKGVGQKTFQVLCDSFEVTET